MDPYTVLGVSQDASKDEIKKAYKKLAMKHHPDKGGSETKFKELTDAYNKLTNDEPSMDFGGFSPFDEMNMFSQMFGGFGFGHRQQPKNDTKTMRKAIHICMKEAYTGLNKKIQINGDEVCTNCRHMCRKCDGNGMRSVQIKKQMGPAVIIQSQLVKCECTYGYIKTKSQCDVCNSTGKIQLNKNIEIKIEPGVQQGRTYNYSNVLNKTNVQFIINIDKRPNYNIENNHIIYKKRISFTDSIFGTTFNVEHPSGEQIEVDTSKLTNIVLEQKVITLQGKGMTKNTNMQVIFKIDYPNSVDRDIQSLPEAKQILQSFFKY